MVLFPGASGPQVHKSAQLHAHTWCYVLVSESCTVLLYILDFDLGRKEGRKKGRKEERKEGRK